MTVGKELSNLSVMVYEGAVRFVVVMMSVLRGNS